jgi:hypothetical protein
MYKLIILIGKLDDPPSFEAAWPEFLHLAEGLPGLQREVTSRVSHQIYGDFECTMTHELLFDSQQEALDALKSPLGQAAGKTLQSITRGKVVLLLARHLEDSLENFRRDPLPHGGS